MSDEEVSGHCMSDDAQQKCTTCQPIVNGLLTFVISIMHNSTDPKLVDVIGCYCDLEQVKDIKSLLCDASLSFKRRQDSESRSEKMAHIRDIVDMLRKLDRDDKIPLFVVDAVGLSRLPRINDEDISYVAVTDRLTAIFNKMNLLNDVMTANTARSLDNANNIKYIRETQVGIISSTTTPSPVVETASMSPTFIPSSVVLYYMVPSSVVMSSGFSSSVVSSASMPSSVVLSIYALTTSVPSFTIPSSVIDCSVPSSTMSTASPPAVHVPVVTNTYKQRTMENVVRASSSVPMATTVSDNNNNTWQVPKKHVQALRKRNSRRIQGTVTGSNVKGAPSPSRTMFIYRVDNYTNDSYVSYVRMDF